MSEMLCEGVGAAFIDYYARLKEAELARFKAEATDRGEVTAWEQNEYFNLF